jgi:hypothetical protein
VSLYTVELKPGESKTVTVQFLNAEQTSARLSVVTTPTLPGDGTTPDVGAQNVVRPIAVQCSSVIK